MSIVINTTQIIFIMIGLMIGAGIFFVVANILEGFIALIKWWFDV